MDLTAMERERERERENERMRERKRKMEHDGATNPQQQSIHIKGTPKHWAWWPMFVRHQVFFNDSDVQGLKGKF